MSAPMTLEEDQLLDYIREHKKELQNTLFYLIANHQKELPISPESIYTLYLFIGELEK
jgi:hypothetical protein